MDWISIESFLVNTVWGTILVGVISTSIFVLISRAIGKLRNGIKAMYLYSKEGRKKIAEKLVKNKDRYFELLGYKFTAIILCFLILIYVGLIDIYVEVQDKYITLHHVAKYILVSSSFILFYTYKMMDKVIRIYFDITDGSKHKEDIDKLD